MSPILRRDLLKAAAALGAVSATSFAVAPDDADAMLNAPAAPDFSTNSPSIFDGDPLRPVQFAESLLTSDVRALDPFASGAPEEMATYKQAMEALCDHFGVFVADLPFDHPLNQLDEAALLLWSAAYIAGVRVGAAAEHLRLAFVTPRQVCDRCHGGGRLWAGTPFRHHDDGTNETVCPTCGGRGTIATPTPTLD